MSGTESAEKEVFERELAYHEKLYSGFAQGHFARPAVRALRRHMVQRILSTTNAGRRSRILSLGCGIGDTELLLAPYVGEVVGLDLSPTGVAQARADAKKLGIKNAKFVQGTVEHYRDKLFDAVIAIFFLHHLPDGTLAAIPGQIRDLLQDGGVFYSLDPSCRRLSAVVGRLLVPGLMKKYQTADERELHPEHVTQLFRESGFQAHSDTYDFASSPLAGLLPGWELGYRTARVVDDHILRIPPLKQRGSNFEVIATR